MQAATSCWIMMTIVTIAVFLLLVADKCNGDGPADHQRKIHGRMLWPKQQPQQQQGIQPEPAVSSNRFPKTGSLLLDEIVPSAGRDGEANTFLSQRSSSAADEHNVEEQEEGGADYVSLMSAGNNGFITFSLAASDAEGADGYSRPRSSTNEHQDQLNEGSKLDLLNQLLRLAPDANEEENAGGGYDKCNHPFHSWMCNKKATIKQVAVPSPPPPPPVIVDVLPDAASVISDVQLTTTTGQPTSTVGGGWQDGADPCTHPFHSWLCASGKTKPKLNTKLTTTTEEPPRPDASAFGDDLLPPPPPAPTTTSTPPPVTSATSAKGSWDGADPCTHPFHSWLCNRSPSAKPKVAPPPPVVVPDASVIDDTFFIPEVIPSTTIKPKTTVPSIIITTMMPKGGGWDEADSCSHPFHSWLCAKPKAKSTTTTTTTTTTTPPPPPPVEEIVFEPAPSIESGNNQLIPDAEPPPPPIKSGWDEADSCSHPFHSWLCAKTPVKSSTPPPPPPPQPVELEFSDASNQVPEPAPEPSPTRSASKTVNKTSWEGADPCTHPFHSWLCNRSASSAASIRSINGRKSVRSSPVSSGSSESELATDEEVIRGSENFESLRLSPSLGRRVRP